MTRIFSRIAHYWLLGTLFVLSTIFAYTNSPLYGADPTPTPNVATVPRPDQIFTPTPTPAPVIVIITREAPPVAATAVAPEDTADGVSDDAGAAPDTAPPATGGNDDTPPGSSPAAQPLAPREQLPTGAGPATVTTASATGSAIALTVTTPTLIWQGAVIQLHFVVSNRSTADLTHLVLAQKLPPALQYQAGQIDNGGSITIEQAPAQGSIVIIRWPLLTQAAVATGTLTVQVKADTPNGLFLDPQAVVQSDEGVTATVWFTLVMPPAGLPQFRKNP